MAIFKPQTIIAFTGDEHTNSTVGLCAVEVATDDGGAYRASKAQLWIYAQFNDFCQKLEKRLKNGIRRNKFILINNGDTVEGSHHHTTQICTSNLAQQVKNAVKTLRPILNLAPDSIYIIRGTPAHSGKSGQQEELFAKDIGAVSVYPDKEDDDNQFSWYFLLAEKEGVLFDIAHRGKFGSVPWTGPNALNQIAFKTQMRYHARNQRIPNVIIRSHTHHWGESGKSEDIKSLVISIPSWQLSTEYGNEISPGDILDIGGYIFEVNNGHYEYEPIIYHPPGHRICQL